MITTTQLTSEQIACFPSITDKEGTSWTLNSDGTITKVNAGGGSGTTLNGTTVTDFSSLQSAVETGTESVIIIGENIALTDVINITREVTIAANSDVTLTSNITDDNCFYLYSSLTLGGGTGTLTIKAPNARGAIIATNSEKRITIKDGVKFTNCSSCCISLTENDTLTIEGGEFSGNTMTPIAIANNSNAVINISGGKIENNSATNMGAGIIVNNGTLNITGGTLQNNVLYGTNSGASIYVGTNGIATVKETAISSGHYTKTIIDGVEQP